MKKRKFTWLDAVLLLVLVAVVAVGAYILLREKPAQLQAQEQDYRVTLRFNQVSEIPFDGYAVGDRMYFQDRVEIMGTIEALEEVPLQSERYDAERGEYVVITDPERTAVEMTVAVRGQSESGKFKIAERELHIGQTLYPQSDTTRSTMTVLNIEEVAA